MIRSDELRIHYTAIPERIKIYFGEQIKDQHELDTWDFDLRNQTLLHRDAAGYYEFAHKSLAEYFVAFKFAAELGCLAPIFAQAYCEENGEPCKIPIEQKGVAELATTFGMVALTNEKMQAVRDMLPTMLAENAKTQLWKIIFETKEQQPDIVKYVGGNSATVLRLRSESFLGRKLSSAVLTGADLSSDDLTEVDLQDAHLREVNLSNCVLTNANLVRSDLAGARVREMTGKLVIWSPDGRWLVTGWTSHHVSIWDTSEWQQVALLRNTIGFDSSICWTKRGDLLATANEDAIQIWDVQGWKLKKRLTNCSDNVAFMLDDTLLVTTRGGGIIGFETQNYTEVLTIPIADWAIRDIDVDRSGRLLALGGFEDGAVDDQDTESVPYAEVWDISTKQRMGTFRRPNTDSQIFDICFVLDAIALASTEHGSTIYILDERLSAVAFKIDEKMKDRRFSGASYSKGKLSFCSKTDQLSFSGIRDKIFLFDTKSQTILADLSHSGDSCIHHHPLGHCLASVGDDAVVYIWDTDQHSPTFGKLIQKRDMRMNCRGMQLRLCPKIS